MNILRMLGWLVAAGVILVVLLLLYVWIEGTLEMRRLRQMHAQAEKKKSVWNGPDGSVGPIEAGYREQQRRATYMSDDPL